MAREKVILMRSIWSKLGTVFAVLFTILSCTDGWGADWMIYGLTRHGEFYYDVSNLTMVSVNSFRIWDKVLYTKDGVDFYVETSGMRFRTLAHSLNLKEIDCARKKTRTLQSTHYSQDGSTISVEENLTDWSFIVPESISELLHEKVCGPLKKGLFKKR
jgi:hypothetical protein